MMLSWMVYAVALSALLGLAALGLERALLARGAPVRWVWVLAIAGSLLLPFVSAGPPVGAPRGGPPGAAVGLGSIEAYAGAKVGAGAAVPAAAGRLDRALAVGWALGSLGLLCAFGLSAATLRRMRRGWRRARIDGEPVLVSESTGPAVIGFLRSEIVLPAWVLEWEGRTQRLLLDHEREHLYAGDPRLLLGALAALALVPWNPALWWQVRRLRLAVEVDCDARVLRRPRDPRSYGLLLLETGRRAGSGWLAVAAFSEPSSFLERRIRILAGSRPRAGRPLALALGGAVALAPLALHAFPAPARPGLDRLLPPGAAREAEPPLAGPRDPAAPGPAFTAFDEEPRLEASRREAEGAARVPIWTRPASDSLRLQPRGDRGI
jgi:bla regulator protein blaR1